MLANNITFTITQEHVLIAIPVIIALYTIIYNITFIAGLVAGFAKIAWENKKTTFHLFLSLAALVCFMVILGNQERKQREQKNKLKYNINDQVIERIENQLNSQKILIKELKNEN